MFKVGDKVRRNSSGLSNDRTVRTVSFSFGHWFNYEGAKPVAEGGEFDINGGCYAPYWELVEEAPAARANDPATSKGKRKVNKYEQAVLSFLACNPDGTGKEIASGMREPLNCITPRFAPLRRKGLIKQAVCPEWRVPLKRDKQIVWVLA